MSNPLLDAVQLASGVERIVQKVSDGHYEVRVQGNMELNPQNSDTGECPCEVEGEVIFIGNNKDNDILTITTNSWRQPCIGSKTNDGLSYGRWSFGSYAGDLRIVVRNCTVICKSKNPDFSIGTYGHEKVPEIVLEGGVLDCPEVNGRSMVYSMICEESSTKFATDPRYFCGQGQVNFDDAQKIALQYCTPEVVSAANPMMSPKVISLFNYYWQTGIDLRPCIEMLNQLDKYDSAHPYILDYCAGAICAYIHTPEYGDGAHVAEDIRDILVQGGSPMHVNIELWRYTIHGWLKKYNLEYGFMPDNELKVKTFIPYVQSRFKPEFIDSLNNQKDILMWCFIMDPTASFEKGKEKEAIKAYFWS